MKYILLLLLLLLPSTAVSQTKYDLSCENVTNIRIIDIRDASRPGKPETINLFIVRIDLKQSATDSFSKLVKEANSIFIDKHGVGHAKRELAFTATGSLIKTDPPDFIGFDERGVTLGAMREQEAVDTARSVCPTLTPHWEKLVHGNFAVPQMGASGLVFDISCENVTNIVITRSANPFLQRYAADGIVHGVLFFLKPEARASFQAFVAASREKLSLTSKKALPPYTPISVTANGKPLRNDLLEIRAYGGTKVCTFIFQESDTFATARSVCPTAPVEVITPPSSIPGAPRE